MRQDMLKIRRKACKVRGDADNPLWERFKDSRRAFNRELDKAKREHWQDWLEKSTDPDLWTAHKYITAAPGDGGKTRIQTSCKAQGEHAVWQTRTKGRGGCWLRHSSPVSWTRKRHPRLLARRSPYARQTRLQKSKYEGQ